MIAGRSWSALISLSAPTAEAPAVETIQSAATTMWPRPMSSAASFVAIPLHAKPRPAPIIVIEAARRPNALSTYGVIVSRPRPTSTSVTSRRWLCVEPRAGAVAAIPATLTTIAIIARCSRLPACSPSIRSAANTSTIRPAASVGCTSTSGASSNATICSGKPRIDIPVPICHRARRSSRQASASRRCSCSGASLASVAW